MSETSIMDYGDKSSGMTAAILSKRIWRVTKEQMIFDSVSSLKISLERVLLKSERSTKVAEIVVKYDELPQRWNQ